MLRSAVRGAFPERPREWSGCLIKAALSELPAAADKGSFMAFDPKVAKTMLKQLKLAQSRADDAQVLLAVEEAAKWLWPAAKPVYQRWYLPSLGGALGIASLCSGGLPHGGITCDGFCERGIAYTSEGCVQVPSEPTHTKSRLHQPCATR
jgi:hypothetical protein